MAEECDYCPDEATDYLRWRAGRGKVSLVLCPEHRAEEVERLGRPIFWRSLSQYAACECAEDHIDYLPCECPKHPFGGRHLLGYEPSPNAATAPENGVK